MPENNHAVPVVEFKEVSKSFGDVLANDGLSFKVWPGTIHGFVGENGAGKSTAMKLLYGMIKADQGQIRVRDRVVDWKNPSAAISFGIGMVHQHFMLAGPYCALDNILLGSEPEKKWSSFFPKIFRTIDRDSGLACLQELSEKYGLHVPFDQNVEDLPVGIQQRVEILKLLYRNAEILILDEPTAVLTPQETQDLFEQLRKLKAQGKTILIITHKLKEVLALTDRVTVFRAGRVVGEVSTSETDEEGLAEMMVGRKVLLRVERTVPRTEGVRPVLLMSKFGLKVNAGEIVGIAGVEGNGQSRLIRAIFEPSLDPELAPVEMFGRDVSGLDTTQIRGLGASWIPEDRHKEALLLDRPVLENFLLGHQRRAEFSTGGLLKIGAIGQAVAKGMEEFDVRPRDAQLPVSSLSGGNQQKLVIAREFYRKPKFLLAAQPTRGVDIGAIEFIHQKMMDAKKEGTGILLISSELEEILNLSDRVYVIYNEKLVAEFARAQCDEKILGVYMGGGKPT